jgi:MoaA/NifB/PqqE/SkfB family radical SAM enzyme
MERSKASMLHVQIELTNNCNTNCIFCPREETPTTGYIEPRIFHKIVQRAIEHQEKFQTPVGIYLCGQGEPLMHPNIVDFIAYVSQYGLFSSIATNGFLLDSKLSKSLIDAGLKEISFSASGINDIYKKIHKFDFEIIKKNILSCLKYSKNKCNVIISIVKCEYNEESIDQIMEYWRHEGIKQFWTFDIMNRAGALDNYKSFIETDIQMEEAKQLFKDRNIMPMCFIPFMDVFFGWDGMYYMCSNDFKKKFPLGSAETYSIADMRKIKIDSRSNSRCPCNNCDNDPINIIRSILLSIKNNEKGMTDLEAALEHAKKDSHLIYGDY